MAEMNGVVLANGDRGRTEVSGNFGKRIPKLH
jgi:hypothetical protein